MAYDGFINKAIINELNNTILDGKIVKIYAPIKDEFIFTIYANNNKYNLNFCINSSNCRINITSERKKNPINPTGFCMLLRKHLIGSKIRKIETLGFDRLIIFHLETYNELNDLINKKLIIELMGKHSNIVLTNENDIIIDSARHIVSERIILPANPYYFPKTNKIDITNISFSKFLEMTKNNPDNFIDFITNTFTGFSKSHIYFIISLLNIDINNIKEEDYKKFYSYVTSLINNINILKMDCTNFEFNNKKDYVIISSENTSKLNINGFIDNYYTSKEKNENFQNYRNNVLKLILNLLKKYKKRLENINNKLEECKDMKKYKLYGELITSNLYKLNNNINVESITLDNYYNNNEQIKIKLDKRYSPSVNAKKFFKKYNKLKNTLEIVSIQKEETKKELDYIESIIYSLNSATSINEVDDIYIEIQENLLDKKINTNKNNNNKNIESTPIRYNIDGYEVYVGKNNKQNDYLTLKLANKNDLWFHTKDIQGSHVILKIDNKNIPTNHIICKVASIAAYYSKAKDSSKVNVQYTEVKNIKKPKGAKPGYVIFSHYKTVLVQPNNYKK